MPSGSNTRLDRAHQRQCRRSIALRHEFALGQADAVLARQRAPERQRQLEHPRQRRFGAGALCRCRPGRRAGSRACCRCRRGRSRRSAGRLARQRPARHRPVREARHRHDHVLVDLARRRSCAALATAPCARPTAARARPRRRHRRVDTRPSPRPRRSAPRSRAAACPRRRRLRSSATRRLRRQVGAADSRASARSRASMNSSIDGVTGCAIIRATARAALTTSR